MSINPFSGFLAPAPAQDLGLLTVRDALTRSTQRDLEQQRRKEVAADDTRANAYLKIQQDDQGHRFAKEGQKEVEALLAEYQDAEDQGDQVRLSRAAQALKRFGMDVGQKPDLRSFTGERALPPTNLRDFTGQQQPEADLSQADFEGQLINDTQAAPSRYEQGGQTTEEFRKLLPQSPDDEPVDMGDVDSPEFQAAAAAEAAPAQAEQTGAPRRLPTQSLPTVISKGGKQLYESTGPSGRWASMVSGVFEPFASHENPEIAAAARRAQSVSAKLIEVDGIPPKEAIKIGMDYLNSEANRLTNLERTKIGSKPKYSGAGGAAPSMKERKPFNDEMNRTYMQFKSEKLDEQFQGYNAGISAISSANTASQYDALNRLIQARSGLTVSDKERAIYDNLSGMWNGLVKKFNLLSGGELPTAYRIQIKTLMNEARQAVIEEKERRAQAAANFYRAKTRGADPESVEQDAQAVADAIRMGAGETAAPQQTEGEYGGL